MKKSISLLLSLFCFTSFAQITVIESDISEVGDIVYQGYDSSPSSSLSIGNPGPNQVWDFSSLQQDLLKTLNFVDPSTTPYGSLYSNANLCMVDNGSFLYFNKTNTGLYLHGLGDTVFSAPALYYPLPLTYNFSASDGPVIILDNTVSGGILSSLLDSATVASLTQGAFYSADTAVITITNTTDFDVDAWGEMTTPLGTYDALRFKTIQTTESVLDVYVSNPSLSIGQWLYDIPFASIPQLSGFNNNQIEYKYQWITNDPAVEFLLLEVFVDASDNIINGISFQSTPPSTAVNDVFNRYVTVYPIPSKDYITIDVLQGDLYNISLYGNNGKSILESTITNTTDIDMSHYSSGIYYLKISSKEGHLVKKVILD